MYLGSSVSNSLTYVTYMSNIGILFKMFSQAYSAVNQKSHHTSNSSLH